MIDSEMKQSSVLANSVARQCYWRRFVEISLLLAALAHPSLSASQHRSMSDHHHPKAKIHGSLACLGGLCVLEQATGEGTGINLLY